jgi:hypothetical protein
MTNTDKKQINCIYAGGSSFSNQLEAVLKSTKKDVLTLDITKSKLANSQWAEILDKLETPMSILIDHTAIDTKNDTADYKINDIIKILNNNPEALVGAILIKEDQLEHITSYNDVLKFYGVDSAGLEKTMHTEDPVTKSQTKDESFI